MGIGEPGGTALADDTGGRGEGEGKPGVAPNVEVTFGLMDEMLSS